MLVTSPCLNLSRGPVGHVTRGSTNLAVRLVPRGCDGDGDHDLDRDRDLDRTRAGGQGAWDSRYRHVFPREYPEGATRTWWWLDVWAAASCGGPPSCGRWSISLSVSPSLRLRPFLLRRFKRPARALPLPQRYSIGMSLLTRRHWPMRVEPVGTRRSRPSRSLGTRLHPSFKLRAVAFPPPSIGRHA